MANSFWGGWAHQDCPPLDKAAAQAVKVQADTHKIEKLQEPRLECSLDTVLQLAAIGMMIGGLDGIYRIKGPTVQAFFGYGEVTITQI